MKSTRRVYRAFWASGGNVPEGGIKLGVSVGPLFARDDVIRSRGLVPPGCVIPDNQPFEAGFPSDECNTLHSPKRANASCALLAAYPAPESHNNTESRKEAYVRLRHRARVSGPRVCYRSGPGSRRVRVRQRSGASRSGAHFPDPQRLDAGPREVWVHVLWRGRGPRGWPGVAVGALSG